MKKLAIVIAMSGVVLAGCDVGPAEGAGGTIAGSDTATGSTEQTPGSDVAAESGASSDGATQQSDAAAIGTRGNPAPIGATASIGDWDVTITDVDRDATARVLEANMFNDEPGEGRSFVLWAIEAVYTGTESGTAWIDLNWLIVGAAGNSFGSGMDDYCGVIPDNLNDKGETFPGAVVTGNVCIAAESAQLDGGTILVEELFGGSRTFFAIP